MKKRTFLTFSLRLDAAEPFHTVMNRVQAALGCSLESGNFGGEPGLVCEVLGTQIGLLRWRGIGGAPVYQLHGFPDQKNRSNLEWDEIRIDQAIIDLLRERGAGEWRQPSPEELKAEGDYNSEDI
jgi:hypothetical protein